MKKFIGSIVPFFLFHLVCCGGLIIFLAASGYLLIASNEGVRRTYLIPSLILGGIFFFLYSKHKKHCDVKENKTFGDHALSIVLYVIFSVIFGIIFMIYVFIPWWIPGYKGGLLLP